MCTWAQGSSPLIYYYCLYTKKIFTRKFDNFPSISKKSYLSFSIYKKYPIEVLMIPLPLVKIYNKKSKIKTKFNVNTTTHV